MSLPVCLYVCTCLPVCLYVCTYDMRTCPLVQGGDLDSVIKFQVHLVHSFKLSDVCVDGLTPPWETKLLLLLHGRQATKHDGALRNVRGQDSLVRGALVPKTSENVWGNQRVQSFATLLSSCRATQSQWRPNEHTKKQHASQTIRHNIKHAAELSECLPNLVCFACAN